MDKPKVVVLAPLPAQMFEAFLDAQPEVSGVLVSVYSGEPGAGLAEAVRGATAIVGDFTFRLGIDARVAEAARGCRLIQQPSIGYQHIDLEATRAAGIPVANAGAANAIGVAEQAIMFMLCLLKKALYFHDRTAQGEWAQAEIFTLGLNELDGKVLGVVGMGHIGREVSRRARAFGCRILYYDPVGLAPADETELGVERLELEDLLRASDIVTLHVPLSPQTRHLIDAEHLALMKPSSFLINTARGEVVDEAAMADALEAGRLAGAGLDVFAREPVDPGNPLLKSDKVMLSPHVAGGTNESRVRMVQVTMDNLLRVLRGEKPLNVVNGVE